MNWYIYNLTCTGVVNACSLNISGKNTLPQVLFSLSVLYPFSLNIFAELSGKHCPPTFGLLSISIGHLAGPLIWHGHCEALRLCENLYPPFLLLFFMKKTDFNLVLIKPLSSLALSGLSGCSVGLLRSEVPLFPMPLQMTRKWCSLSYILDGHLNATGI